MNALAPCSHGVEEPRSLQAARGVSYDDCHRLMAYQSYSSTGPGPSRILRTTVAVRCRGTPKPSSTLDPNPHAWTLHPTPLDASTRTPTLDPNPLAWTLSLTPSSLGPMNAIAFRSPRPRSPGLCAMARGVSYKGLAGTDYSDTAPPTRVISPLRFRQVLIRHATISSPFFLHPWAPFFLHTSCRLLAETQTKLARCINITQTRTLLGLIAHQEAWHARQDLPRECHVLGYGLRPIIWRSCRTREAHSRCPLLTIPFSALTRLEIGTMHLRYHWSACGALLRSFCRLTAPPRLHSSAGLTNLSFRALTRLEIGMLHSRDTRSASRAHKGVFAAPTTAFWRPCRTSSSITRKEAYSPHVLSTAVAMPTTLWPRRAHATPGMQEPYLLRR